MPRLSWIVCLLLLALSTTGGCATKRKVPLRAATRVKPPAAPRVLRLRYLPAAFELANPAMRILFASAKDGLGCVGISAARGPRFVRASDVGQPTLWRITLVGKNGAPTKLAISRFLPPEPAVVITNRTHAAAVNFVTQAGAAGQRVADLTWTGVDLPGEPKALDVRARITLAANGTSQWTIRVTNHSRDYGIWRVAYPFLNVVSPAGSANVIFPAGFLGGGLMRNCSTGGLFRYPGFRMSVQFTAFIRKHVGLYLAAADAHGWVKNLRITRAQDACFEQYPTAMATPGTGFHSHYPIVIRLFHGNWWAAAKIYRAWAVAHLLAKDSLLSRRPIPRAFKDTGIVMNAWVSPAEVARIALHMRKQFSVPVTAFWCEWGEHKFDHNDPDLFPARPGFAAAVRQMLAAGITPMPYLNLRLWMADNPFYRTAPVRQACVRLYNGAIPKEFGGETLWPGAVLAQHTWLRLCAKLMDQAHVPAIYCDQAMGAGTRFDFAIDHGHPPGGAGSWTKAYLHVVAKIRAAARRCHQKLALVSETFSDAYVNAFDGGLPCWYQWHAFQSAIPLIPAVYSGYTILLPNCDNFAAQSLAAYVMIQGRYFLWGVPFAVHQDEFKHTAVPEFIASADFAAANRFLAQAARVRYAARKFMVYGQLLGALKSTVPQPRVTTDWGKRRWSQKTPDLVPVTFPAVRASLWRSQTGDLGIALINFTNTQRKFSFRLDPVLYFAGKAPQHWQIVELRSTGERKLGDATAPISAATTLKPYHAQFLVLKAKP